MCSLRRNNILGLIALTLTTVASATAQVKPNPPQHATPFTPAPVVLAPIGTAAVLPINSTSWTAIGPAPLSAGISFSGRIVAIAAHPTDANTIYVAPAGGGVWKTINGGTAWTPLTDTQVTLSMGCLAMAPSNTSVLYAGTGEANNSGDSNFGRGILVSTDGGATWTQRTGPGNVFSLDRMTCSKIAVDPTNANVAYAAMANFGTNGVFTAGITGIYKTTDGGATWTNVTAANGLQSSYPWSDVAVDPNTSSTVYGAVGYLFGRSTNGVYKSTDSGTTWTLLNAANAPVGSNFGRITLAISKANNANVLYISAEDNTTTGGLAKFVRSDNGGTSFTDLTGGTPNYMGGQGWYDTTLLVDPTNSAIVYVAGSPDTGSTFRSTNSGVTWTDVSTGGASPHADHHGIALDANGKLLDGDDGGIFRLDTVSPVSWSDLNGNLNTIQFEGIGLHPTNPNTAIAGSQDNGTELFTGSLIWTLTDGGDGGNAKFSSTNGSRAYHQLPNGSSGTNFFRRSDTGGTAGSWVTKTASISTDVNTQNFYASFSVDPLNGDRVLYGTNGVWESTTGGDSWTKIGVSGTAGFANTGSCGTAAPTGTCVDTIGIAASDTNTIYAATGGAFAFSSKIFVTTSHGALWTNVSIAGAGRVNEIDVDPANAQIAYAVVNRFNSGHIWKTINGGGLWTDISGDFSNLPVWSLKLGAAGKLYIGADDGVYSTTNGGTNWTRFATGLPNAQVFEIVINNSTQILAAATHGRGAWEISLTPVVGTPDLTITKMHVGNFTKGQTGATYTITATNSGTAATTAAVSVTDKLPAGLTATALTGAGWTCVLGTLTCTRSDALAATASYPAIMLTVNVAANAAASVTNTVTVSGGGETNTANDTANDVTTINTVQPTPPTADSVTPNASTSSSQVFTFKYSSANGFAYLNAVYALFNSSLSVPNGCVTVYVQPTNSIYLANDAGSAVTGPLTPGSAGTLSNSQCTINGTGSSVSGAGNTLTVLLSITSKPAFKGPQSIYGYAVDNGSMVSGWQPLGTWTPNPSSGPPTTDSVTPNNGSGSTQTFVYKYSSPNGFGFINYVYTLINSTLTVPNGCVTLYVQSTNKLYLFNDAGNVIIGPITPGLQGSLSNSQCTISGPGSSAGGSGNTLTLSVSTSFTPSFLGSKMIYGAVSDNANLTSGWQLLGSYLVK